MDAIFEAAARLLDDAGVEGATTARIAHVAGVSIGSLYQYFPKKEALFGALTERAIAEDLARVRDAVDRAREMPLVEGAREVLRSGFAFALERPRLFCWMLRYLPELGLLRAAEEMERALIAETTRFLEDHRSEIGEGDPGLLATAGVGAVRGALLTLARERPDFMENGERVLDLAVDLTIGGLVQNRYRAAGWPKA